MLNRDVDVLMLSLGPPKCRTVLYVEVKNRQEAEGGGRDDGVRGN